MILKSLLLFLAMGLASCQVYNSNSADDVTYYPGGVVEGAARAILSRNCASCHSFHQMTDDELIATGRVVAGQPDNSTLIIRLRGADLGGNENMPPSYALSADQILSLRTWIQAIQ